MQSNETKLLPFKIVTFLKSRQVNPLAHIKKDPKGIKKSLITIAPLITPKTRQLAAIPPLGLHPAPLIKTKVNPRAIIRPKIVTPPQISPPSTVPGLAKQEGRISHPSKIP